MNLSDLFRTTAWPAVRRSLLRYYPAVRKELGQLEKVYLGLLPAAPVRSGTRVCVAVLTKTRPGAAVAPDVFGLDGGMDEKGREKRWALEFEPWENWLGMEIDPAAGKDFPGPDIAALCLYEMTFLSYDQKKIRAKAEELARINRLIDRMSPEEAEKYFIPLDEYLRPSPTAGRRSGKGPKSSGDRA